MADPITRDQIEERLRALHRDVTEAGESARQLAVVGGAVLAVVVVALAFGVGRRRGRRLQTVVEVRRV